MEQKQNKIANKKNESQKKNQVLTEKNKSCRQK